MTEEQKSSETSASETDWEAPRQNKAVDTSNATSNESHQANTAESVEETAEGTQPAYGKNPNTAAARHTGVIRQTPTTKFCPKCGASLREGMPFCGTCGAKVGSAAFRTNGDEEKEQRQTQGDCGNCRHCSRYCPNRHLRDTRLDNIAARAHRPRRF